MADGGIGGTDGLAFIDASDVTSVLNPSGADSSGTSSSATYGKAIDYAGIDEIDYYNDTDPLNPGISGTVYDQPPFLSIRPTLRG